MIIGNDASAGRAKQPLVREIEPAYAVGDDVDIRGRGGVRAAVRCARASMLHTAVNAINKFFLMIDVLLFFFFFLLPVRLSPVRGLRRRNQWVSDDNVFTVTRVVLACAPVRVYVWFSVKPTRTKTNANRVNNRHSKPLVVAIRILRVTVAVRARARVYVCVCVRAPNPATV